MMTDTTRLTYRSQFGDYGFNGDLTDLRYKIANRLGAYEDLGSVEALRLLIERFKKDADAANINGQADC